METTRRKAKTPGVTTSTVDSKIMQATQSIKNAEFGVKPYQLVQPEA